MHFDLVDLRLLIHIAENRSFTRGAEQSNLSLPSASKRVKNLEESLGLKLLYRTSHGVTLTPVGQTFVQHARNVRSNLEHLRSDLDQYIKGSSGHLRIQANATTISESLAAVLPKFIVCHPGINIDLQERANSEILKAAAEGSIDIGIVIAGQQLQGVHGLETLPYRRERLVLVTPCDHPLGQRESVLFEETLQYDHIGMLQASTLHTVLSEAAEHLGQQLRTRMRLGNCDAICRMVEAGTGVAILPHLAARRHAMKMDIELVALADDWAARGLHIVVQKMETLPQYARDLMDLLIAQAGREEPATGAIRDFAHAP